MCCQIEIVQLFSSICNYFRSLLIVSEWERTHNIETMDAVRKNIGTRNFINSGVVRIKIRDLYSSYFFKIFIVTDIVENS